MVISQIQSLYRDEDDLFRTVIKRIWEEQVGDKWVVKKVESSTRTANLLSPLNIGTAGSFRRNGNSLARSRSTSGSRCRKASMTMRARPGLLGEA